MLFIYFKNKICNKFIYVLFIIFLFGILSGIPFLLILSTLNVWLLEVGFNKTQIGLFSLATIPYSFKFIFGFYVDYLRIPFFSLFFGQKKSWLIFSQFLLVISIIFLCMKNPYSNFFYSLFFVFFIGLFSAIQDVIVEAYRIELLKIYKIEFSLGSMIFVLGYRFGMLISGPGALYISFYCNSWSLTYFIMSLFIFFGLIITSFLENSKDSFDISSNNLLSFKFFFTYFFTISDFKIALFFIIFFKIGDTVLNIMTVPFLFELGFSKIEIIYFVKTFGIFLMIFGGFFGGGILIKNNLWTLLLICCILQIITCFFFLIQSLIGYNVVFLLYVIALENLVSGMSQIAIVTYFSYLCYFKYTATCYSFFSSFSSFIRINFSFLGGILADFFLWDYFYLFIGLICFPSVIFLFYFKKHFIGIEKKK